MSAQPTVVVVDTPGGKEYRLPTAIEEEAAHAAATALPDAAAQIPFGLPTEQQQKNPRTLIVQLYGLDSWDKLYTPRQLLALVTFTKLSRLARGEMRQHGYSSIQIEAVAAYLALAVDRIADRGGNSISHWDIGSEGVVNAFQRFVLQISWDFSEACPISSSGGSYLGQIDWIARFVTHALEIAVCDELPKVLRQSATDDLGGEYDAIVTDPPYYNAIPYADLSDFFYVWLRRTVGDSYPDELLSPIAPKGEELALRLPHTDIPEEHTTEWYEKGMTSAFRRAYESLVPNGCMVVVFAHKDADAWERLVSALISVGFKVSASWPIDTEMGNRTRANNSAALSSSIWLVCRKRSVESVIGRHIEVRRQMEERINERLRYFWDLGVSGPNFVWAAVGPALESYSKYREVRRMDGSTFTVGEFLREVRRLVADFALGRILHGASTEGLDEWTRYYLMHRSNFGLANAPVGECILLAQGYGLDLSELKGPRGILGKGKVKKVAEPELEEGEAVEEQQELKGIGSEIRLIAFDERKRDDLGEPHSSGGLPLIDMLHRLMQLWRLGDATLLSAYVQRHGLGQNELFWAVAQAIVEMAEPETRERTVLEAVVAWGRGKGDTHPAQLSFGAP